LRVPHFACPAPWLCHAGQHAARARTVEHVIGAAPVVRLPFGQLEQDRQAKCIDQRMDFGDQAAARTTHAAGSAIFFLALAACW